MVISASRRTDIPAYYSDWFINRLKSGYVYVRNPFNPKQVSNVILDPKLVDCIVFWTKDARPITKKLPILEKLGYRHYGFQYTITPYDKTVEPGIEDKSEIVDSFIKLSKLLGPERMVWRYDPIFLDNKFNAAFHFDAFARYCEMLHSHCKCVVISFIDSYKHTKKKHDIIREDDIAYLSAKISDLCASYGISVQSCCEKIIGTQGIKQGACIDKDFISQICGFDLQLGVAKNQRPKCLCYESIDVGAYNTCFCGCTYCYANRSIPSVEHYDSSSPLLCSSLSLEDKLYDRAVSSNMVCCEQLSIF